MRRATITQAKNQLSSLIDLVRAGETVLITDRGRPVAQLVDARVPSADDDQGRLARLQRQGVVRVGARPSGALSPPPVPQAGASLLAALLAERESGR